MQLLNNLFRVGWHHLLYVTSLVSLQQANVKKFEKSMKIVNIEGENLHIF